MNVCTFKHSVIVQILNQIEMVTSYILPQNLDGIKTGREHFQLHWFLHVLP